MYPTLYHALLDLTGLDLPFLRFINSFGFFVALAFLAASWTLTLELERRTKLGWLKPVERKAIVGGPATPSEMISNGLLGFLLGWKGLYLILNFAETSADPQGFLLSGKGNFFGGLAVAALFAWMRFAQRKKESKGGKREETVTLRPADHAGNITLTAALWGLIGAKIFHWLENPDELVSFFRDPRGTDVFSGLTMYGGLIVGGAMVIRYMVRNGIPAFQGMDSAAPGLMLSYAVGRIGCQVSGDGDWGIANTNPAPAWIPDRLWSYDYPNNVNGVGVPIIDGTCFEGYCTHLSPPVYPTPLYEIIVCTLFFGILWAIRKRLVVPGVLFATYLMLNGVERFWIEKIRVNNNLIGTWTQAEVISILLFLLGAGGALWLMKRNATPKSDPVENE